jgi:hypothetical protein
MVKASRFDSAPLQTAIDEQEPRWRKWFLDVWSNINALSLPLPTVIVVTASPFIYQYLGAGQVDVIVSGGTVNPVQFSRDGVNYFTIATATPGMFSLSQGDYLKVTYTVAPTMELVVR